MFFSNCVIYHLKPRLWFSSSHALLVQTQHLHLKLAASHVTTLFFSLSANKNVVKIINMFPLIIIGRLLPFPPGSLSHGELFDECLCVLVHNFVFFCYVRVVAILKEKDYIWIFWAISISFLYQLDNCFGNYHIPVFKILV